ncbi:hypothetical protein [Pseudorhodoferax sp. Leaf274]|uniref:hypothetical protein n=1 Tax=Pseudorhodoferax sp. Leaf274 TaxID=1736318 RepID=UPI0007035DA5|nr:hypothetical protein [Pseudorhodoferax sp. Leaf274]KQP37574.1 hypothetical protein ASF44_14625 [Pseudorhodoferax sp. Leaf274]
MIGTQPTGAIAGAVVSTVSHEGLSVHVDGKPARLAIVLDDGTIVSAGPAVAREVEAVAINGYRAMLKAQGFLRTYGQPIAVGAGGAA